MKTTLRPCLVLGLLLVLPSVATADVPEPPKPSTFAPAEDLARQVPEYLEDLENAVKTEADHRDGQDKIVKDANTLIVIALALGLHDQENQYKAAAPAMMKAAGELAATKDYASAKAAVEALKTACSSKSGGQSLKWEKVASLNALMKAVPTIDSNLKRFTRSNRLKRMAKESTGCTAVLAAIAQASMYHGADTKKPNEAAKWYQECAEMRTAAAAVNTAVRSGDQDATDAAMKRLAKSCDTCHEIFKPEVPSTTPGGAEPVQN